LSNNIAIFHGIVNKCRFGTSLESMHMTAYMGGPHGKCIQLTFGDQYFCLAENQVKELIDVLMKRLYCYPGYSATDWGEAKEFWPEVVRE